MKIIISTGGTGGHIFPALSTAIELKKRGHDVIFIGSLGLGQEKIASKGFECINIPSQGVLKKTPISILKFVIANFRAISESLKLISIINPDKVIGYGGYGSLAMVVAARIKGYKVMIHEQNVFPGKANRLLSKFVSKIAISFNESKTYFESQKTVWTGCPCLNTRPQLSKIEICNKYHLDSTKRTILVLGGSQGSQRINEVIFELLTSMTEDLNIQVVWMTGKKDVAFYKSKINTAKCKTLVYDFISPIEDIYSIADLVIARSGAATVSELGSWLIPSILIPYPLADGHQKYNAQVLEKLGFSRIINQQDLSKELLLEQMKYFLNSSFKRETFQDKMSESFKKNAAESLAIEIENL